MAPGGHDRAAAFLADAELLLSAADVDVATVYDRYDRYDRCDRCDRCDRFRDL